MTPITVKRRRRRAIHLNLPGQHGQKDPHGRGGARPVERTERLVAPQTAGPACAENSIAAAEKQHCEGSAGASLYKYRGRECSDRRALFV